MSEEHARQSSYLGRQNLRHRLTDSDNDEFADDDTAPLTTDYKPPRAMEPFAVRALGFFADAYDLFVMNLANLILSELSDEYNSTYKTIVTSCVIIGVIIGMVVFGLLADSLGRARIHLKTRPTCTQSHH